MNNDLWCGYCCKTSHNTADCWSTRSADAVLLAPGQQRPPAFANVGEALRNLNTDPAILEALQRKTK